MLLDPDTESDVAYELCQLVGRAILPVRAGDALGTAFFFAAAGGGEYLLTAAALTRTPVGEFGLRPSVTGPSDVAGDSLTVPDFAGRWSRSGPGAAIMPTAGLHELADGAGWRWRTQQVPEAIAADADTIAGIGAEPGSAVVLALGVGEGGGRPLEVAIERYASEGDMVRLTAELPDGYVGAPVFGVLDGGDGEVGLCCLGLVLPAERGGHPVATFDRIRAAVADLA